MVIQRIQTLYLFIAAAVAGAAVFLCAVRLASCGAACYASIAMSALLLLSACLSIAAIANFKKLKRQTKLCMLNMILLVAYYPVALFFILKFKAGMGDALRLGWALALPLVALVFVGLAVRAIKRDKRLLDDANSMRLRD